MTHCLILQFWDEGWRDAVSTDGEDVMTLREWVRGESKYNRPYRVVRRMELVVSCNKPESANDPSLGKWIEKNCLKGVM